MSSKQEIAVTYQVDGIDIKLTPSIVQNYLVGSDAQITMPEFKFFTELCRARGLNPFLKEAYLIKYKGKPAQLVVGRDAVQKRAILHPQFNGMESGIIVRNIKGEISERQGLFYTDDEDVVGGWARGYRKDWQYPTYISVAVEEAAQRKQDGNRNHMWHTKTATMIEKVAKVRVLREMFVDTLGGMYEAEEMGVDLPIEQGIIQAESLPVEHNEPLEGEVIPMGEL